MKRALTAVVILLILFTAGIVQGQGIQKFAELGDYRLENGQVIRACKLGYRTFGTLDEKKSNAMLIPTWFTGTSEALAENIGQGRLFDDTRYYIIAVDAFGNGVSSSPSNSAAQPGAAFPEFTITDMVNAQHTFLSEKLGLTHIRAVAGISMGGMQTFQWMVSYPDFMDKAIPIVGTPCQTAYDLLLWTTELSVIEALHGKPEGDRQAMKIVAGIHALALTTPSNVNHQTKPEDFPQFFADQEKSMRRFDALDFAWQLKAMLGHNIYKPFEGSMGKAASSIKASTLIIVSHQDHMVNPAPALELAKLMRVETLELTNDCGHLGVGCENENIGETISRFLK